MNVKYYLNILQKFLNEILEILKKNRNIIYSSVLIFAIPGILFFSSFYSLKKFEKNFNHLIQTKGIAIEKVFVSCLNDDIVMKEVQNKINKIVLENSDIRELKIIEIGSDQRGSKVLASSNHTEIDTEIYDIKDFLAIGMNEGVAGIVSEQGVRFWEVVKKVEIGGKDVLIKIKISLAEVDQAFQQNINRTYWSIVLASLVLILLVTNYARLSRYALMYNKIKEIDEMKDDFVSMASHELKTPLTAINGYLDLLETADKKLNKDERHYLENIKVSSNRLRNLVSDILEVSRIEQGRMSFEYSEVSVLAISDKVIDGLLPKANEKKLKLNLQNQLGESSDLIYADVARLEQILINLVGNSIKYTEKGTVSVFVGVDKENIQIAVEDTGIGMSAEESEKLFGKFNRIKNDKTSKIEGTGLGLWITKQLIEEMKGKISVESMKGKGSRFLVSFKLLKTHSKPHRNS